MNKREAEQKGTRAQQIEALHQELDKIRQALAEAMEIDNPQWIKELNKDKQRVLSRMRDSKTAKLESEDS